MKCNINNVDILHKDLGHLSDLSLLVLIHDLQKGQWDNNFKK